jgi:Transporter associated domain
VTLEDLLEEIVGEIYDETDRDILAVRPMPDGSLVVPGTFPIHDLPDINVDVTDAVAGGYATIAGLVLAALGRLPTTPGDRVELARWTVEVTKLRRRTTPSPKSGCDRAVADTAIRVHKQPGAAVQVRSTGLWGFRQVTESPPPSQI